MTNNQSSQSTFLIDRSALRAHKKRAYKGDIKDYDFLYREIIESIMDRISLIRRSFGTVVVIGPKDTKLEQWLLKHKSKHVFFLNPYQPQNAHLQADEDCFPFAHETIDAIIAPATLQWCNDLPGALIQIRQALKPDGLFLAALPGSQTLAELRTVLTAAELEIRGGIAPRIAPAIDLKDAAGLLQRAGFALPVGDNENTTVCYKNLISLMKDLRGMGETNALTKRSPLPLTRSILNMSEKLYFENFSDNGTIILANYDIIYLTGWTPHSSQQQPLKPGSAQHSLAETLG